MFRADVKKSLIKAKEIWFETKNRYSSSDNIEVDTEYEKKEENLWMSFFTDRKKISAFVYEEEKVDKAFDKVVSLYSDNFRNPKKILQNYFDDEKTIEELMQKNSKEDIFNDVKRNIILDTFIYLLDHEYGHFFAPDGNKDREKVKAEIYRAYRIENPGEPESKTKNKVDSTSNLNFDNICDKRVFSLFNHEITRLFSDAVEYSYNALNRNILGKKIKKVPKNIMPVWDIIDRTRMGDEARNELFSLSRLYYTALFSENGTSKDLYDFFSEPLLKMGVKDNEKFLRGSLKSFINGIDSKELEKRGVNVSEYNTHVNKIADFLSSSMEKDPKESREYISKTLNTLFTSKFRYRAVHGFNRFIYPYVKENEKAGRSIETSGDSSGADSTQNLTDLLNGLSPQEAQNLSASVANNSGNNAGQQAERGIGCGKTDKEKDESIIAADDYFKRFPPLDLVSTIHGYESFAVGKVEKWVPDYSETISDGMLAEKLSQINDHIEEMEQADDSRNVLIKLDEGWWQVNWHKKIEYEEMTYKGKRSGVEPPKLIVLVNDTSSSMGPKDYIKSGKPIETDQIFNYRLMKGQRKIEDELGEDIYICGGNFSNETNISEIMKLKQAYEERINSFKRTILPSQCGGTSLEIEKMRELKNKIKKTPELEKGKKIYAFTTDGDISNDDEFVEFIKCTCKDENTSVIYLTTSKPGEAEYDLGENEKVKKDNTSKKIEALAKESKNLTFKYLSDMRELMGMGNLFVNYEKDQEKEDRLKKDIIEQERILNKKLAGER